MSGSSSGGSAASIFCSIARTSSSRPLKASDTSAVICYSLSFPCSSNDQRAQAFCEGVHVAALLHLRGVEGGADEHLVEHVDVDIRAHQTLLNPGAHQRPEFGEDAFVEQLLGADVQFPVAGAV